MISVFLFIFFVSTIALAVEKSNTTDELHECQAALEAYETSTTKAPATEPPPTTEPPTTEPPVNPPGPVRIN